ncbi:hypothetical protein [Microbulbifer sp. ZKSA002]|uniref:hypothetical protein n=1 Tax=Microbulbifer sp. ZKSA002 TaxID=3243388 RepID=UPI00403942BD
MSNLENNSSTNEKRILGAASAAVIRRERSLDTETLAELRRIRSAAQEQNNKKRYFSLNTLYPYLPVTAASAAVLFLALWWPSSVINNESRTELLVSGDWLLDEDMDIEMIEDMEFYQWLAEELDGHSS